MKKLVRRCLAGGTLILLALQLQAQVTIGGYSLISTPAPYLRSSISLASGVRSAGFLGMVGGVAFDQIAKPAAGFEAHTMKLEYVKSNADGERMVFTVDGQPATAELYDWQLLPIARFAESKDSACYTLFGHLKDDPLRESLIRRDGGRILNYAAAFSDTLVGLRLFQLDNLIIQDFAADLPKDGGRYILGAGERPPDIASNTAGVKAFKAEMQRIAKTIDTHYDSYVIGDLGRTIEFSVQGGKLRISGEPSYYFWRPYGDDAGFHEIEVEQGVQNKVNADIKAQRAANSAGFNEHTWLVNQLLQLASSWDGSESSVDDFDDLLRMKPADRRKALNSMDVEELRDMLAEVRLERIAMRPVVQCATSGVGLEGIVGGLKTVQTWMSAHSPSHASEAALLIGSPSSGDCGIAPAPGPPGGPGHHAHRGRAAGACGRGHRAIAGHAQSADRQATPRLHPHAV